MNNDPIANQIEGIGSRRLFGCLVRVLLALVLGGTLLGLVARCAHSRILTGAVALALSGLLFGFATSFLTFRMRKLVSSAFLAFAVAASLTMLVARTCCGWEARLPLEIVFVPLVLPVAFRLGQARANR